jgi:transposase-like protein
MSVQLIPVNQRKARRFTPQQKLQILKEWELTGNGVEVAQKHQIHPMTLYRWGKALQQGAQSFLSGKRPKKGGHL